MKSDCRIILLVKKIPNVSFFIVLFSVIYLLGCATTPPPKPEPVEPLIYDFTFDPPESSKNKIGITIGIVAPQWGDDAFNYSTHFCNKSSEKLIGPDYSATKGPLPERLVGILKEFHNATAHEFEAVLLNQGFDTDGPFAKIDDMTYPQKKSCNLVLIPKFNMKVYAQPEHTFFTEMTGTASMRSEVVLYILEPLSGEKLWLKRINIQSKEFPYKYTYKTHKLYNQNSEKIGVERDGVKWDNRTQRFAGTLSLFYKELMETSWKYLSPEELTVLKNHSDDIRKNKRF